MNRKPFSIALAALIALMVGVAGSVAQGPAPEGVTETQTPVDSKFTFQGHLKDSSGFLSDTCDFQFGLYETATGGLPIFTQPANNVEVQEGRFTVQLDFGSNAFKGDARYLQIAVKCSGDPAFVDLDGRMALTAAPYALSLMPGAHVVGDTANGSPLTLSNLSSSGAGPALYATTASSATYASAVYGKVTHPSPGQHSAAVRGSNLGTAASGAGVWGSHAAAGTGVFGTASSGTGVFGYALSSIAYNYGVFGRTDSPLGIGVSGWHTSLSGLGPGVKGETLSTDDEAAGVLGQVTGASPGAYSAGVRGISEGTGLKGIGVYGSQAGSGWGVYGTTPSGVGVYGLHDGTTGTQPGVKGETQSTDASAVGVLGRVTSTSPGSMSTGVQGINEGTGPNGIGVYGEQKGSGWGVYGKSASGYAGYFDGDIYVAGNCVNCKLAYVGLNDGDEPLMTGDLVAASGVSSPRAGMTTPLLRLRRVDAGNAEAVVGVVQSRAQVAGRQSNGGQEIDNIVPAEGPAAPGDYVFVVVQGLVQVKAHAGDGTIQVGDDLVVAGTPAGHAGQALGNHELLRIGRAMENLTQGVGLIWVMVDLR